MIGLLTKLHFVATSGQWNAFERAITDGNLWLGLILGAMLGVVADRLWRLVEEKPHVRLAFSASTYVHGAESVLYEVENTGKVELPPFDLVIFHPDRGSLSIFSPKMTEGLLPKQRFRFEFVIPTTNTQTRPLIHWIEHARATHTDAPFDGKFSFQLRMAASNRLLFESSTIGNTLTTVLARAIKGGAIGAIHSSDWKALNADSSSVFKRWLHRIRVHRELRRITEGVKPT